MKYGKLFIVVVLMVSLQSQAVGERSELSDPKVIPVTTRQPEEGKIYSIAIIGSGAAGTMAVKRAVLNNNEALLFTGAKQERRRSRGNWVRKVDNVPGLAKYQRTVLELRNEVLQELVQSPLSHNLYVIEDSVFGITKGSDFFTLTDGSGRTYCAKYVVMATGIMDEQPHIQGSIRPIFKYANAQSVAYCAMCDGHRSFGKKTVVIGHSESAGSIALLLVQNYQLANMTILTNGRAHEFTPALLKRIQDNHIRIIDAPIQEMLGNAEQKLLTAFKLETGEVVESEMGFIALGIRPNNQLALMLGAQVDESGLVITDLHGETEVSNLFVIGDLQASSMKQIYTAWQQAIDAIQLINRRIRR
jgi:thioredoxin reductase (NADPH)